MCITFIPVANNMPKCPSLLLPDLSGKKNDNTSEILLPFPEGSW
jgi:hypothetical protein